MDKKRILKQLFELAEGFEQEAKQLLADIISFPSVHANELGVQQHILDKFNGLGLNAEFVPIDNSIREDPEYTHPPDGDIDFKDRPNVVVTKKGTGGGRSIILNCHSDVIPAEEWPDAFKPAIDGDIVFGRGACDDKGQVAVIYLALAALASANIQLKGDLKIHPANRGALWFKATVEGKPVPMGRIDEGVSAIDHAIEIINLFRGYEQQLLAESKNHPLFSMYKRPVQMNVGIMHAGDWPATVPAKAVIEGGMGFLPGRTLQQVGNELKQAIENNGSKWLKEHYSLEFGKVHNDAYETPVDHPLVSAIQDSCEQMGLPSDLSGFVVSCDARLFSKVGKMPTVVFGPGKLAHAHSSIEQINIKDVVKAAKTLIHLLVNWCEIDDRNNSEESRSC